MLDKKVYMEEWRLRNRKELLKKKLKYYYAHRELKPSKWITLICSLCKKEFKRIQWMHTQHQSRGCIKNYCSVKCKSKSQSINHGCNWKGGRQKQGNYIAIWVSKGKRIREHRLVMERKIGRKLKRGEVVHHINGNPSDNRIENLVICKSHGLHTRDYHRDTVGRKRKS